MASKIYVKAVIISLVIASCNTTRNSNFDWDTATLEEKIEYMRSDSIWIAELDSLAQEAIGEGAKCLDPVKHLFTYEDEYWLFNQDWGGVLEIPKGYIPEDELNQVELSFHGSYVTSPDSTIRIGYYAGWESMTFEEFKDAAQSQFYKNKTTSVEAFSIDDYTFPDGFCTKAITIKTNNDSDGAGFCRYIYKDSDNVGYSVSVEYPAEREPEILPILEMIKQYPLNCSNQVAKGQCL